MTNVRTRRKSLAIESLETRQMLAAPNFLEGTIAGTVQTRLLPEASGLVASRQNAGVMWSLNDVNDTRLYAMTTGGTHLGTYTLGGLTAGDWEDIAIGPGPQAGVNYLYVADTGDNARVRTSIAVHRIAEPSVSSTQAPLDTVVSGVETMTFVYPDGPHDAETLIVDPANGDIYLVTKREARGLIYYAPAPQSTSQVTTLQLVGQLTWTGAAGGAISPDGDEILLLNATNAFYYSRPAGTSIAAALTKPPDHLPYTQQRAGEAITFDPSGTDYITASEGYNQPLWKYKRVAGTQTDLIPSGATWKYLQQLNDQGTAWREVNFNDTTWKAGRAELGYGDKDELTLLPSKVSGIRPITTYFRRSFEVFDPAALSSVRMWLKRDDGAVVYLNGQEIIRSNMPEGTIAFATRASSTVGGSTESQWFSYSIDPALFLAGTNVMAVEVHQDSPDSSDLSFDLELDGLSLPQPELAGALVRNGSTWMYLDDGSNQGTAWQQLGFADTTWKSGPAELGFGDGGEATLLSNGVSGARPVTFYFRRLFDVVDPTRYSGLTLHIKRDDGAVVYINGQEVVRSNMPAGTIGYRTLASSGVASGDEVTWFPYSVSSSLLVPGLNIIAVEVHQSSTSNTDLSFDLQLVPEMAAVAELTGPETTSLAAARAALESAAASLGLLKETPNLRSGAALSPLVLEAKLRRTLTELAPASVYERVFEEIGLGRWLATRARRVMFRGR